MGKGDRRTKRGKIKNSSFGNARSKKVNKSVVTVHKAENKLAK